MKQLTNNLDWFFSLAEFDHHDKKQFNETFSDLKKVVDTNLSMFKKFIDLEDSKKVATAHESRIQFKTLRILQEIACMISLVRIYYLKKEQDRGLFFITDETFEQSQNAPTVEMSNDNMKMNKSEKSVSINID